MDHRPTARRAADRLLRWAVWGLGAVALAHLIIEHRPHLFGWLPYLIILACPLMHFFMHRGHHHGGTSSDRTSQSEDAGKNA
jgi:hypothetical protein